jgi:L-2-hydroxyglutarate oxidase LhgO
MHVVIVGGGILGLATARLLATRDPGTEVTVIEKEPEPGRHQTATNSGVVHAGLYYAPGSLKARLCRRGVELLKAYCAEHQLPYDECGKVVVALGASELPRLDQLEARAHANGVPDLLRIDADGLRAIEPHATGIAGLHSPRTAITDFRRIATAMAAELPKRGGVVRYATTVTAVRRSGPGAVVQLGDDTHVIADRVIVCAGLHADRLARASGQPAEPRIIPFRGEYWQLRDDRRQLVNGLIYPVPDPTLPFLGVHLTRKVDGSVLIGPNAVLGLAREGYRWSTVRRRDVAETIAWPGTWRMMRTHWRTGVAELARSTSKAMFIREARRYVPELRPTDAIRAGSGVRAQAVDRDGSLVDDFRLGGDGRVVWVRNAPSPAATSSMAIAEELVGSIHGA